MKKKKSGAFYLFDTEKQLILFIFAIIIINTIKTTMGYLQNNLTEGENIVYQANIHWFIFVRPVLLLL